MSDEKTPLPPAAQRASGRSRRTAQERKWRSALQTELGGRDGPEPVRYGDWEKKGIAVDF